MSESNGRRKEKGTNFVPYETKIVFEGKSFVRVMAGVKKREQILCPTEQKLYLKEQILFPLTNDLCLWLHISQT